MKLLLLLRRGYSLLAERDKIVETHLGKIDTRKVRVGGVVRSHLGNEFVVVEPTLKDLIKKFRRGPQVILPKDLSLVLAYTGIGPKSLVLDAGSGSGFAAIMLANFIARGKVITYERDKRFIRIARENIELAGLKNVELRERDVTKGFDEKNVDLVLLDLKPATKVIKHAYIALKAGGHLVVYSPTVEELLEVNREIEKFNFVERVVVENIVREWKYEKTLRPKTKGLMHTGFLTIARKLN